VAMRSTDGYHDGTLDQRASCARKRAHATEAEAAAMLPPLEKRNGMTVYRCHWCQSFHIGHASRRRRKGARGARRRAK
jgi:hypothetical protein